MTDKRSQSNPARVAVVAFAVVIAIFVVPKLLHSSPAAPSAAAFTTWETTVRHDLDDCVTGVKGTAIEINAMEAPGATQAEKVKASMIAAEAKQLCNTTLDQGSSAFASNSANPPSGYPSLANVADEILLWISPATTNVLTNVQNVANSNGSTGSTAALLTDAQTADAQAEQINHQIAQAAKLAGVSVTVTVPAWKLTGS